jgi:hypothetical protein
MYFGVPVISRDARIRASNAIRHVGYAGAWDLPHGLDDVRGKRSFFDHVLMVSQSLLQLFITCGPSGEETQFCEF